VSWRLARSLIRLLAQVNASAPGRSRTSDGTVGDAAHSSRASDHNPDAQGIVRALDLTHDPGRFDAHAFADRLLAAQDVRLKYVISRGRIGSGPAGLSPGKWRPYSGSNPHDKHVHVSVVAGDLGDRDGAWTGVTAAVARADRDREDDDVTPQDIERVAQRVAELLGQPKGRMTLGDRADRSYRLHKAIAEKLGVDWKAHQ
jgi:hypothetical protein